MQRTSWRRAPLITGVIVAALVAAISVSPAVGGTNSTVQASWVCDPALFDSLEQPRRLVDGARRWGDSRARPEPAPGPSARRSARPGGSNFRVTVPTWVHVVSDGAIGNVSDAAISDQMRVLNMTFAGQEGGDRTGFSFQLVGITAHEQRRLALRRHRQRRAPHEASAPPRR